MCLSKIYMLMLMVSEHPLSLPSPQKFFTSFQSKMLSDLLCSFNSEVVSFSETLTCSSSCMTHFLQSLDVQIFLYLIQLHLSTYGLRHFNNFLRITKSFLTFFSWTQSVAVPRRCSTKWMFLKISQIHRETCVKESLFK